MTGSPGGGPAEVRTVRLRLRPPANSNVPVLLDRWHHLDIPRYLPIGGGVDDRRAQTKKLEPRLP
jgi:hypothetical protein